MCVYVGKSASSTLQQASRNIPIDMRRLALAFAMSIVGAYCDFPYAPIGEYPRLATCAYLPHLSVPSRLPGLSACISVIPYRWWTE